MLSLKYCGNALNKILRRNYSDYPKTFKVGDSVSVSKHINKQDIVNFSKISGDVNPVHLGVNGEKSIVHGAYLNGLVSGIIGSKLPGPGTLVVSQNLNFPNKCYDEETVNITVKLIENRKLIKVEFICEVAEQKKVVLFGDARLILNK